MDNPKSKQHKHRARNSTSSTSQSRVKILRSTSVIAAIQKWNGLDIVPSSSSSSSSMYSSNSSSSVCSTASTSHLSSSSSVDLTMPLIPLAAHENGKELEYNTMNSSHRQNHRLLPRQQQSSNNVRRRRCRSADEVLLMLGNNRHQMKNHPPWRIYDHQQAANRLRKSNSPVSKPVDEFSSRAVGSFIVGSSPIPILYSKEKTKSVDSDEHEEHDDATVSLDNSTNVSPALAPRPYRTMSLPDEGKWTRWMKQKHSDDCELLEEGDEVNETSSNVDMFLEDFLIERKQPPNTNVDTWMVKNMQLALRKASCVEKSGEINTSEYQRIKDLILASYLQNDKQGLERVIRSLVLSDMDDDSLSSPSRQHSFIPTTGSVATTKSDSSVSLLHTVLEEFGKDQHLSQLRKEEAVAIEWSINHAWGQKMISEQLSKALLSVLHRATSDGSTSSSSNSSSNHPLEDVRDALFHKCHLIPATTPTSFVGPSVKDHEVQQELDLILESAGQIENTRERLRKVEALLQLSQLLLTWVKSTTTNQQQCFRSSSSDSSVGETSSEHHSQEQSLPNTTHRGGGGAAVFVAGSFRFGLNDRESDIDCVCVVPWHISREAFFTHFCKILGDAPCVSALTAIPHAYVPIISVVFYDQVNVDVLFARLPRPTIIHPCHHLDVDSDFILAGVDPASVKSLNAVRTATLVLGLVPDRSVFRVALRAIRLWARRRGIYSAKHGYLGGISWAILVAFVCQLYPRALSSTIVVRFFQVFSEWPWPSPVFLSCGYDAGLGLEQWDPLSKMYDRMHSWMPIITPAYPSMNSASQVSHSTFGLIMEEFWRARSFVELVEYSSSKQSERPNSVSKTEKKSFAAVTATTMTPHPVEVTSPSQSSSSLEALFTPSDFFRRYCWYLVLDFSAPTCAQMHSWEKFVTSRLRKLIESLQHIRTLGRVHGFPVEFKQNSTNGDFSACVFVGLEILDHGPPLPPNSPDDRTNTSLNQVNAEVRFFLSTDLQQVPSREDGQCASARIVAQADLPECVSDHSQDPEGKLNSIDR